MNEYINGWDGCDEWAGVVVNVNGYNVRRCVHAWQGYVRICPYPSLLPHIYLPAVNTFYMADHT